MSREKALAAAALRLEDDRFLDLLAGLVAHRTESQRPDALPALQSYLDDAVAPHLTSLGFSCRTVANTFPGGPPFLVARRAEGAELPTLLFYGHGDVVHGMAGRWTGDRDPWTLSLTGERVYGRGTADNKGQHAVFFAAVEALIETRGALGFNCVVLLEMGEERGSPGLREFCRANRSKLAADLFLASDGPRLSADLPTVVLGSRGLMNLRLRLNLRDSAHHSGNWGGALANPAIVIANAIASIVGPTGRILVPELLPPPLAPGLREALRACPVGGGPEDPVVDEGWGEPGLSPAERVYGWNSFETLALGAGDPDAPMNAIPPEATAICQLRFVVGTDWENVVPALRRHLDAAGFARIEVSQMRDEIMVPTRLDHDSPEVRWVAASIERSLGKPAAILPNIGGGLPNGVFLEELGMPAIWIPHSYPGCRQHAPDEHNLLPVLREGLAMTTGLLCDFGEGRFPIGRASTAA